ncbi:MAG: sensor histidine kinase [Planctomycetota bacterium]
MGNPAGALRHVKRAQEVRASQFRREADVRIRSIQAAQELQLERERSAEVLRDLSQRVMESQEEERRRIASELHDGLGQELALLAVEADMLAQSQREPEEFAETLRGISEHAQSIASQVHAISHALHPAPLEQLGVITATRSLCDELARVHGVEIEVTADETRASVPRDVALCLYRIAQEALGNAIRHGQTKRASVRIAVADDAIGLVVADEGIGFDESTKRSGLGLVGMRERVRHLGGRFGLTSQPNEGTRIEVELPTKKAPSPDGERASGAGEQT